MKVRNIPAKCSLTDIRKLFDRRIESCELKGQQARVCFAGSDADAIKFHEAWNGKVLGNRRVEMMIDWEG